MFLQNDSICERVCPWRLIGTRQSCESERWSGGCPSQLTWSPVYHFIDWLILWTFSSYIMICHLYSIKVLLYLYRMLYSITTKIAPSKFQSQDLSWSKVGSEPTQIATGMKNLGTEYVPKADQSLKSKSAETAPQATVPKRHLPLRQNGTDCSNSVIYSHPVHIRGD